MTRSGTLASSPRFFPGLRYCDPVYGLAGRVEGRKQWPDEILLLFLRSVRTPDAIVRLSLLPAWNQKFSRAVVSGNRALDPILSPSGTCPAR